MKTLILLIAFSLVSFSLSYGIVPLQTGADFSELKGKSCKVSIVDKIKNFHKVFDKISFSLTGFISENCSNEGMYLCGCDIYADNDIKYFTIEFKNEHNKKKIWEGSIQYGRINGTITYYNGNKNPVVYIFTGDL